MKMDKGLLYLFPVSMRPRWQSVADIAGQVQEIRLRRDKPTILMTRDGERYLQKDGSLGKEEGEAYIPEGRDLEEILNYMCNYSIYAFEDEIRKGFLTMPGGHRVGVAGQAVLGDGDCIRSLKHISYMNIRVAHEVQGAADGVIPYLYENGKLCNTLIISPPGCGKTTLLRDLIRQVSEGNSYGGGVTVGVVDERSEIAGSFMGVVQNDVGKRTDVLDGCPKVSGMMMLVRAMGPKVIAVDELGSAEDYQALKRASACGCGLLATVHGDGIWELKTKEEIRNVLKQDLFSRYIVMEKRGGKPGVKKIYGKDLQICCECWGEY